MENRIEISYNKTESIKVIVGATLFIVFGIGFIVIPDYFLSPFFPNTILIQSVGFIAVIFFGACLLYAMKFLMANTPGLIIDNYGITDNTSGISAGFIEWEDITQIVKKNIASSKSIVIYTNKPQKYINRKKNILSRKALLLNYKISGSPIMIVSNTLKISFEDLEKLISSEFQKRKGNIS